MRPLVLFDLNGTLILRKGAKMSLRPGIEHLYLLKELFELGIYTSMTRKNAVLALKAIGACFVELFHEDCVLLHREHTTVVGRPKLWSTVKPVRKWLPAHPLIFVVDDSSDKSLPEEAHLFVPIPTWTGAKDDELHGVVRHLLDSPHQ